MAVLGDPEWGCVQLGESRKCAYWSFDSTPGHRRFNDFGVIAVGRRCRNLRNPGYFDTNATGRSRSPPGLKADHGKRGRLRELDWLGPRAAC